MKLHGSLVSPYVARVVMYARAKGLELERAPAAGSKSDLLLGHPRLAADGRHLEGAASICEYLDERYPGRPLGLSDPTDATRSREVVETLDVAVLGRLTPLIRDLHPARRNAGEVQAATVELDTGLIRLEGCLGPGPYAVGSTLSAADCALLPAMALLTLLFVPAFRWKSPLATLPRLADWWAQMGEDPLCVLMLQEWTMEYQRVMRELR